MYSTAFIRRQHSIQLYSDSCSWCALSTHSVAQKWFIAISILYPSRAACRQMLSYPNGMRMRTQAWRIREKKKCVNKRNCDKCAPTSSAHIDNMKEELLTDECNQNKCLHSNCVYFNWILKSYNCHFQTNKIVICRLFLVTTYLRRVLRCGVFHAISATSIRQLSAKWHDECPWIKAIEIRKKRFVTSLHLL